MIPPAPRAQREQGAAKRFSMMLWTAGAALILVVFIILGLSSDAPREFWTRGAVVVAVLLLLLRVVARRLKVHNPKSARPDPRSRLNLD